MNNDILASRKHWPRWVHASIGTYLDAVGETENYPTLISGIEDRTNEFDKEPNKVEVRVNGPNIYEPSKGYFRGEVAINILITSNMGECKDRYIHDRILGIFFEALDEKIPIRSCGPDPDIDKDEQIACLCIQSGDNQGVKMFRFDSPDPNDRVRQAMLTATYDVEFS